MSLRRFVVGSAFVAATGLALTIFGNGAPTARAQQIPPAARMYGSIQINGQNAPNGAVVTAYSGSTLCGTSTTSGNGGDYNGTQYKVDIDSSQSACATAGTNITFKVNGQSATQTAQVPQVSSAVQVNLTVGGGTTPAPGGSGQVTYSPGWNLVGGPAGTTFTQAAATLYNLPAGASDYTQIANTTGIDAGKGYWAYFGASTTITLSGTTALPFTASLPAGVYGMIGNPTTQTVTVTGADLVYVFDPVANKYNTATTLAPGQGAFVLSNAGGTVTLK